MSDLIVIAFDNSEEAEKVRESLAKGEHGGYISLDDSAVIVKDESGKIHIKNELDRGVKVGALGGSLIGLLVFGIFAPLGGLIAGAIGGGIVGSLTGRGISNSFTKEVAESLKPDTSAIFFIVRDADVDYAMALLRNYEGKIIQTTLPEETEEELRKELKGK